MFQDTYFTNVHREDDKVTKWVRANYTYGSLGDSLELGMVAARIFNRPETLQRILGFLRPYNMKGIHSMLEGMRDDKLQIWGGAYLITTHGRKMPKIDYCVELLQEADMLLPYKKMGINCSTYYEYLMIIDGIGSFLSAQIVADLKNTEGHILQQAEDWMTFSAPGPGSLRGLAWYHDAKITPSDYQGAIREVARELDWDHCMQDLQNCLCEFDKYCRVRSGQGRSKRNYAGK